MHRLVLKDKIQIGRSAEDVWHFLQSPAHMKEWNPGIRAVVPVFLGEQAEGCRYRIRYEINGRESNFLAEVMEYREPSRLLIHFTGGNLPRKGYIQEMYELTANTNGTLLRKQTDIYTSGARVCSGCLSALFHYLGNLSKKRHLLTLKHLAESR